MKIIQVCYNGVEATEFFNDLPAAFQAVHNKDVRATVIVDGDSVANYDPIGGWRFIGEAA